MSDYDLIVVGGGINGAGIARDAAGRGLSVLLVERDDLAGHTSSASTKLIHGGLRYLEYYEFRLVREALIERERLLAIAPHIIWPLTFVLPQPPGGRPAWLVRLGLFLYDHIGGRKRLPASRGVSLKDGVLGAALKPEVTRGFTYADCWVEDSRLVALNAVDARERGAEVRVGTALVAARREAARWVVTLRDAGGQSEVTGRAVVNAAGAWVGDVLATAAGGKGHRPRLVKGSHLVVPRLFDGEQAYILQNPDKRIVFAIPYEGRFTLIGTTDIPYADDPSRPAISDAEVAYLCESVNRYFAQGVTAADVVRSYSGVRPLFDDGSDDASAVTRDYVLELDAGEDGGEDCGAPAVLSVFGGKITTYRRLAEHALEKLAPHLPAMTGPWTASAPLPGGDIPGGDFAGFLAEAGRRWPFLAEPVARRLARAYGTRMAALLGDAGSMADLGEDFGGGDFGGGLTAREIDWLMAEEWARTPDDLLWRRSKLGLHMDAAARERVAGYMAGHALRSS